MVVKILKHPASSAQPLDYNERKCLEGTAEVVHVANISSDSFWAIRHTLEEREAIPPVSNRPRKTGFHMAVNPGSDDTIDETGVICFIDDAMNGLGMGQQPYVVYRHNDIDRQHYHVVGVRVDEHGRIVRDSFSWRRLQHLQKQLGKKYGFGLGLADENQPKEKPKPRRLKKGMRNMIAQMAANIEEAMHYVHHGEMEFRAVLQCFRMAMNRGTKKGSDGKEHGYVSFHGIDAHGKNINHPVQAKRILGMSFDEYYAKHLRDKAKQRNVDRYRVVGDSVRSIFAASSDMADFAHRLNLAGIGIFLLKANGDVPKRKSDIADIIFVDIRNRICLSCEDCGLSVSRILEVDARKRKEERQKKEAAKQALPSARRRKA